MRDGTITLGQAAAWCGGTVAPQFAKTAFHGAGFDTRRLRAGELFVALVGARNGHAFARAAMEKGAAGILASEGLDADLPAIYVEDTEKALQAIAKQRRAQLSLRCVGITGSVGKTTTKEMIAAVLETTFVTQKTAENFNNGIGLPVTVLGLREDCEAAVLEMGMNHFGEISALTRIAQPDIAVITNVGTMHIENLGSREGILRAKLEILEGLRPNGIAVFNGDDALLRREAAKHHALTFGRGKENDVRAHRVRVEEAYTAFTAAGFGEEFSVTLPVAGEHYVPDALAAITVGLQCGVSADKITAALADFRNTGMRQRCYDRDGLHIIEDCYNAGPESMHAALRVLQGARGRRIAVLGGMLELGDFAPQAHYEIGQAAAHAADILLAYGENCEEYVHGARAAGLDDACCFPTHEALVEALRGTVRPQDTLLVKGSRGMRMERVLRLLFDSEI